MADPKLPDNAVDLILIVDVYHEMDHPVEMLAAMRKSLSKHGRMVLVEFRAEDRHVPIKDAAQDEQSAGKKEITANGFKLVEQYDDLPWQHVMFFERDEEWKGVLRSDGELGKAVVGRQQSPCLHGEWGEG